MGTSSPGKGPRPTTPLIPRWIPNTPGPPPPQQDPQNNNDSEHNSNTRQPIPDAASTGEPNRYYEARRNFTAFARNNSSSAHRNHLNKALKNYVSKSSGGSATLAKRMTPSISRIASFYNVVNTFREQGSAVAFRTFNIENYSDKPVIDILAALTDIIFDASSPYHNTQDDSIAKMAYANTISRIAETENIDLDALTPQNVEVMMAIYIEETIATRVICDVGASLYKEINDPAEIIQAEETIYQIVTGLVRNQIMPEIVATRLGTSADLEKNIQRIYRIAFDCIAESNVQ